MRRIIPVSGYDTSVMQHNRRNLSDRDAWILMPKVFKTNGVGNSNGNFMSVKGFGGNPQLAPIITQYPSSVRIPFDPIGLVNQPPEQGVVGNNRIWNALFGRKCEAFGCGWQGRAGNLPVNQPNHQAIGRSGQILFFRSNAVIHFHKRAGAVSFKSDIQLTRSAFPFELETTLRPRHNLWQWKVSNVNGLHQN